MVSQQKNCSQKLPAQPTQTLMRGYRVLITLESFRIITIIVSLTDMQDTSSNNSYIQDENSLIINRTISESQFSSPRSQLSSTSKRINLNQLKIAQKPNLTERSFKRIPTLNYLQDTSNIPNRTVNIPHNSKPSNHKLGEEEIDNILKKNNELSSREKLLTEQNKYLSIQNQQLKKKLEAFNNIQIRIQNLEGLNQVLEERLREKQKLATTNP